MTGKNWGKVPSVGQRNSEVKRVHGAHEGEVRTSAVLVKSRLLTFARALIGSQRDILGMDEGIPKSQK